MKNERSGSNSRLGRRSLFCIVVTCACVSTFGATEASEIPPSPSFWLDPVIVIASRQSSGEVVFLIDKNYPSKVFRKDGFSLICKGIPFTSDLYADGLKRGDIEVLIDGERFPAACGRGRVFTLDIFGFNCQM